MTKSLELVWIQQEPVRVFSTAHFESAAAQSGQSRFIATFVCGRVRIRGVRAHLGFQFGYNAAPTPLMTTLASGETVEDISATTPAGFGDALRTLFIAFFLETHGTRMAKSIARGTFVWLEPVCGNYGSYVWNDLV